MTTPRLRGILLAAALASPSLHALHADTRAIDPKRSTLTVHVFKSGLLSSFGDNHVVRAPIESGSVTEGAESGVEIAVDARQMTVLDPELAADKRSEVQKRMLGPDVLDVTKFKAIRFHSTKVRPLADVHWRVEGILELHGHSAPLSFEVKRAKGQYRGSARISQKAFGIQAIRAVGGTVNVKDELEVDFDIATTASEKH